MKKDCYQLYDYARRILPEDGKELCEVVDVSEDSNSPADSLLRLVYKPDERTGLPTGDLHYLVSDKANPQVKQFILDNLLMDVSSAQNVSAKYNLSDDDILALSRNKGESASEYADRLNQSIARDKWMIEQAKKNVSPKSEDPAVSTE